MRCPLCAATTDTPLLETAQRRYARCERCDLIFLHPDDRPRPLDEVMRYLEHRNSWSDAGYRTFLRQLAAPLCATVPEGARGLDVGCGPTPVLAGILTASGRPTAHYDPLFHADHSVFATTYDFVTCTEVAEHAHDPRALFSRLFSAVRAGGILALMTQLHSDETDFEEWWYRRDLTHVCFYSARTLSWLAEHFDCELRDPAPNVAFFTTRPGGT